jgi:phosphatidylserine/phosphatidylglycerophosphate/cardiolipin synthase-like enzyme
VRFGCPSIAQEIHYAPEERLDRIDADLIATAKTSIDLAAFSLTDPTGLDALNAAASHGVKVRLVLDPREPQGWIVLDDFADDVRIKRGGRLQHLKSCAIDQGVLRD